MHALPVFARDHQTGAMKELAPGTQEEIALAGEPADPSHSRVLVLDDDKRDRQLTICQLGNTWPAERDMIVECAVDGAEALEKIRRTRYALAVLDWNIRRPDGADVLRAMRENGLRVPVVVVSRQDRKGIPIDLEEMAAAFLNKNEMDTITFRNAIVASILLQDGVFGVVRSGHDASLDAWLKNRKSVLARGFDPFRGPKRVGRRPGSPQGIRAASPSPEAQASAMHTVDKQLMLLEVRPSKKLSSSPRPQSPT